MKLFLVQYHNGGYYEQEEIEEIGIFESLGKATEFITSCGFTASNKDNTYFIRQHENVIGECVAHQDYALIYEYELNEPKEDIDYFTHHYKN
jgi:hypothetical protein